MVLIVIVICLIVLNLLEDKSSRVQVVSVQVEITKQSQTYSAKTTYVNMQMSNLTIHLAPALKVFLMEVVLKFTITFQETK